MLALFIGSEADGEDECQIGVADLRWRRWKRRGTLNQVESLSVEKCRPGALDDPAARDVAMPINGKSETDYTLHAARLWRIALKACKARHERLLPTCSR